MTSSLWIQLFAKIAHRTQANTFTSSSKGIIKDTDGQPGAEVHRARTGWVLGTGAPVPVELGCTVCQVGECVHPPASVPRPLLLGFFGGFFT